MEIGSDLTAIVSQLQAAVELTMSQNTSPSLRMEAYQILENFKESSSFCSQCGVIMASKEHDTYSRHFGLQLLEHCVKLRWNSMVIEEKQYIKENALRLISEGTLDLMSEQKYIKDALSRIVVEIAKREWPQQWTSMLAELDAIYCLGPTQTELVLLIFLRLAEDILIFQTAPFQRRREIMQGLTMVMLQLFTCFVNTVESHFRSHISLMSDPSETNQSLAAVSSKVGLVAIETLSTFVDWINISVIMDQDGRLLSLMVSMLEDATFRYGAAECLLEIVNRKGGKIEERRPIVDTLFKEESMAALLHAAVTAASFAELNEQSYVFLKKLCQVFVTLGQMLCAIWGPVSGVSEPATFHQYLEAILAFSLHPSQVLRNRCQSLWQTMLKHEKIAKEDTLRSFIAKLVESARTLLEKDGMPSKNNSQSCHYASFDFDTDEDFLLFFPKCRAEVAETIRCAAAVYPDVVFHCVAVQITEHLKQPINLGNDYHGDFPYCSFSSPSYIHWDALALFLESTLSRMVIKTASESVVSEGVKLFESILSYNTPDPMIKSKLMYAISSMLPFIDQAPHLLRPVLDTIFATAVYNFEGQTKSSRSKFVKNLRRHACSGLVKICKQYPGLLLPGFNQLYSHIRQISEDPEQLSQMEKCTLMEALILISNENKNFAIQENFINEIIQPVKAIWLHDSVKQAVWCVESFVDFIGLNRPPVLPSSGDTSGINRSQMQYCGSAILAVLKRSLGPEDVEEATAGGFVVGTSESGAPILRNPAGRILLQLMENVLVLTKTLNELHLPENLALRNPEFSNALDLTEYDKQALLVPLPMHVIERKNVILAPTAETVSTNKDPKYRMRSFLSTLFDLCYQIIGNAGQSLSHEFYQSPNLTSTIKNTIFAHLTVLPDYRLRVMIRYFLRPFVHSCPKEHYKSVVLPLLAVFCPYLYQLLSTRWKIINERQNVDDDDHRETQEILDEQIVRHLTREFFDFMALILRDKKGAMQVEVSDEMIIDECELAKKPKEDFVIGELGQCILQDNEIFPSLVLTIFVSLTWEDTATCVKSINWCYPLLKQLVALNKLEEIYACDFLEAIVFGLNTHGQHDGAQAPLISSLLQVYELLVPLYPAVRNVLLQIPSCSEKDLQAFEEKLAATTPQMKLSDKKKREMFRSLIQDAIGKNIGQRFKNNIQIKDLRPFVFRSTRATAPPPPVSDMESIGLCALFANGD